MQKNRDKTKRQQTPYANMGYSARHASLRRLFPWGLSFASRRNYECGYFVKEAALVRKYLINPARILILGSGNGREGRPLSRSGHKIVCVDYGLGYLISGARLTEQEGIKNMSFLQADALALPFQKGCFDVVFCSIYSSTKDKKTALSREIKRILKPGGTVFFLLPTPRYRQLGEGEDDWTICASVEEAKRETEKAGFIFIEGGIDPVRPEYLFSVLRNKTLKRQSL